MKVYRLEIGDESSVWSAYDLVMTQIDRKGNHYTEYEFKAELHDYNPQEGWIETTSLDDAKHLADICYCCDIICPEDEAGLLETAEMLYDEERDLY